MDSIESRQKRVMRVSPTNLRRELSLCPEKVKRYSQMDYQSAYDFAMDWDNQMFDLEDTYAQYSRGELPASESEEFLALLSEVVKVLPLIRGTRLHVPDIPDELYPKAPLRQAM